MWNVSNNNDVKTEETIHWEVIGVRNNFCLNLTNSSSEIFTSYCLSFYRLLLIQPLISWSAREP